MARRRGGREKAGMVADGGGEAGTGGVFGGEGGARSQMVPGVFGGRGGGLVSVRKVT